MKFIFPIILLIASVGLFVVYVNPTYQHDQALSAEASDYNQALSKASELRARREELTQQYDAIDSSDIDRLTKLLPDSVDNVRLIININDIAEKYGMNIKDIQISEDNANSGETLGPNTQSYGTITLSFGITSTYENFEAFLKDLESSLRIVDVTSLSFSSASAKNDTYDYSVSLQTYWLK